MAEHDPFSNWADLFNKPVYSVDGKKLGFLRKVTPDNMVVKKGLVSLKRYVIPKSLAESVSKKGIRLHITAYEAFTKYSYVRAKRSLFRQGKSDLEPQKVYDRLQTIRYSTTRNRIAASIAFISGLLFVISGYRANIEIYSLIREQVVINTVREFWTIAVIPIGFLAILAQLGGFTVMMGAGLFAANRVNIGKFLVMVGTGQGLFTILLRLLSELGSGTFSLDNNYILTLTTTATGLGIIFSAVAAYISKGKGKSISVRMVRYIWKKGKRSGNKSWLAKRRGKGETDGSIA